MRFVLVLGLALFAAGCVDDAPSAAVPVATPSTAPADGPADGAPEAAEPERPLEVLTIPESVTLQQGAVVCPPETRTHCVAPTGVPAWQMADWIQGDLASIRLVATWTAATPATTSLRLYAGACIGVEEDYTCESFVDIEGASPLEVNVPSITKEFNYYYVGIRVIDATPYVSASPEQDVTLDGEITWHRA